MVGEKLFFTIGEAAQLFDIKPYVLRYWETEFKQLNPQKSETGQRVYRTKDLQVCQTIKRLLYVEKYTIAGAKQKLVELEKTGFDPLPVDQEEMSKNLANSTATEPAQEGKGHLKTSPANTNPQIAREKGLEFKALLREIRRILQKYNLA